MSTPLPASRDLDAELEAKVDFLRRPESFPEPTRKVWAIETHMSWVFLTDRHAYKLKKPVRLPFLNFSTLELRQRFCEEEVRLNRRLAPRVYIGTVPITATVGGAMTLAGEGAVIDWLVKMHRLPAERMLDHAIRRGTASVGDIDRFARRLAAFYRAQPPVELAAAEYRRRFQDYVDANLEALATFDEVLPRDTLGRVHAAQTELLRDAPTLVEDRVRERRIIEAHGDLRPEHVALGKDPQIIDCLEFNAEFRTLDPADELCFLGMECKMLGAPEIGSMVFERYRQACDDAPDSRLLDFYRCYRACLRAKIALWHIHDRRVRDAARWPVLARRYLGLADHYASRLSRAS